MDAGEFAFRGLKRSGYTLKFSLDGYEPAEVKVDLGFGSVRGTTVYLKRVRSSTGTPANSPSVSSHELSMPEQARKLLVSGRGKLYRDKNPQGALEDFQKALAKASTQYELEYEIGMVYLTLGQTRMAEDSFLKVIGASKDSFGDAQIALGTLLVDKGEWEEGGKRLQRGMQLNPSSWMGHYQSARLETIQGKLAEAEADGEQARSLAPNAAINYRLLSIIHLR
jgi:tetratricopeptide (TPR) repeat protein